MCAILGRLLSRDMGLSRIAASVPSANLHERIPNYTSPERNVNHPQKQKVSRLYNALVRDRGKHGSYRVRRQAVSQLACCVTEQSGVLSAHRDVLQVVESGKDGNAAKARDAREQSFANFPLFYCTIKL